MSLLVFAGAAQFAAIAVLAAGGDILTAAAAGTLINLRFLPMSLAVTPSMPPGLLRRCLMCVGMTDPGWALAARSDGRFDAFFMLGAAGPQYVLWQAGTIVGALFSTTLSDPEVFGVDALLPAFFLAILVSGEVRADRVGVIVAALGGLIALLLIPVAPPGIPLIAASTAALFVLLRPRERFPEGDDE